MPLHNQDWKRSHNKTYLGKNGWGGFLLGDKHSGASDGRHAEINDIIEKKCSRIGSKKHAEEYYKFNLLVGRDEDIEGSWEEWLWIYD